jgi:hypothetical protein
VTHLRLNNFIIIVIIIIIIIIIIIERCFSDSASFETPCTTLFLFFLLNQVTALLDVLLRLKCHTM